MKFVIAQFKHETHTFVPQLTTRDDFSLTNQPLGRDAEQAVRSSKARNNALIAYLDLVKHAGHDYSIALAAEAWPSGRVQSDAYEWMCDQITESVSQGCDAVLLDLHGAMASEQYDDAEGELLRRIRAVATDIPIGVALDPHCILTSQMVDNATVITTYRTVPHIDRYETGVRAARTLFSALEGSTKPVMVARRLPLMASLEKMGHTEPPMKTLADLAAQMETQRSGILNASVAGAHPFTDVYPNGMTVVIVADGNPTMAHDAAHELLTLAWQHRREFIVEIEPYIDTLRRAKTLTGNPIVMADSGDIAASGGFAADMTVIGEAIAMGFDDLVAGPIHDARSVRQMADAGVGATVSLALGGKTSAPLANYVGEPLAISGRVKAIADGQFTCTGPMTGGMKVSLGLVGVLSTPTMDILVTEKRFEALDPSIYHHVGIDVSKKKYVLLKSRMHFTAGFAPVAAHMLRVAGPGVTSPRIAGLPFRKIARPIFPLEPDTPFELMRLGKY